MRLNILLHAIHRNLTAPSGAVTTEYTVDCAALFNLLSLRELAVFDIIFLSCCRLKASRFSSVAILPFSVFVIDPCACIVDNVLLWLLECPVVVAGG